MRILLIIAFLAILIYGLYRLWNSKWLNTFAIDCYDDGSKNVDNIKKNIQDAEQSKEDNIRAARNLKEEKQSELDALDKIIPDEDK